MRRFVCLFTLIFSVSAIQAQTAAGSGVFPLAPVLEAAEFAASPAGIWRPDWPLELPPDAFRLHAGEAARITLEGDGLRLSFYTDQEGRAIEFPFMLNGAMAQVSLDFQQQEIREMTVSFPQTQELWEFEFLEYQDSYPALVRAFISGDWFFVSFSRWDRGITETWFDPEGNVLAVHDFSLIEIGGRQRISAAQDILNPANAGIRWYFDSWGLAARISGPAGSYAVLHHRDTLPRYWERRPAAGNGTGDFYLQWDAGGFLVRLTEMNLSQAAEYRFEYTLDEKGNWIKRQEIRMYHQAGLFFPAPGAVFTRVLEYRQL